MIRHEMLTTTLRFYNAPSDNPFQPFDAVCTLQWESPHVVWVKALHGTLTRQLLRELVRFFKSQNITTVKASRELSKTLPYVSKRTDTYVEIDIQLIPDGPTPS